MRHLRREGGAQPAWTEAAGGGAERRRTGRAGAGGAGAHAGSATGPARVGRAASHGRPDDGRGRPRPGPGRRHRPPLARPLGAEPGRAAGRADLRCVAGGRAQAGEPTRRTPEQVCHITARACELPATTGRPIRQWAGRRGRPARPHRPLLLAPRDAAAESPPAGSRAACGAGSPRPPTTGGTRRSPVCAPSTAPRPSARRGGSAPWAPTS